MSRIPIYEVYFVSINELYFVSNHVKNSNQRGVLRLRGVPPAANKTTVKLKQSERIPMIPRVTHTRLPEGRQDFKLRATGGVRLGESTNLTIACPLMLKGFILPNCRLCAAPSCWLSLRSKVVRCCEKDILLSNS